MRQKPEPHLRPLPPTRCVSFRLAASRKKRIFHVFHTKKIKFALSTLWNFILRLMFTH